jgi:hypothetical protein
MADTEELEFDTPLEEEVESIDVPAGKRTIYTEAADPEVDSLYNTSKRESLSFNQTFSVSSCGMLRWQVD